MKSPVLIAAALLAALPAAGPAAAIDCGKASTVVERAICADPRLLTADDAMSRAYGEVRELSSDAERGMLLLAQRAWIAERDEACGRAWVDLGACVGTRTAHRLAKLLGKPDNGPGNGSRVIPVYIVQPGDARSYRLDIALMRFARPATAGETRFNAWAEDIAAKLPTESQDVGGSPAPHEALVHMSITYLSPDFLSAHALYEYYAGGAHPSRSGTNINIDMKTGKELAVEDLLSEVGAAEIAGRCYDQIAAEKKERLDDPAYDPANDPSLDRQVIAEHVATMSRWMIGANEAVLQFNEYAVGSYAEGSYGCSFPTPDFKALALPGAPLP